MGGVFYCFVGNQDRFSGEVQRLVLYTIDSVLIRLIIRPGKLDGPLAKSTPIVF